MPKPNINTYQVSMMEGCLVLWSRCQSRHMLQGGTTGLSGYRTLQEPQEQVPAQELEQQEVQELYGGIRGQQRFAADEGGVDGMCRPGRYRMNRWYSSDGITRPTAWREGTHQGDMLI